MAGAKILIADDEARMRKLVADFLKKEGYTVSEAEDGRQALECFLSDPNNFNLVILDVMMPGYDGWAVCREIRKISRVPVIMLTARSEESDELFGFDLGADEYITKPFSPLILVARVQALLRRASGEAREILAFDGLEIDESGRVVRVLGEKIDLSPKEFELLLYLAANEGIALSREQILNAVWNFDYFGDARTVDTHIKKLRLKLGAKGDLIQTIRGLGYKFEVAS
jgi:two-component system response regulator ResD